jgi:hypothetical protein
MNEPLRADAVKRLVRVILEDGLISFTSHADKEMRADELAKVDVENVLRGGVASEGEWENGQWRYRMYTQRIAVVIAFRSPGRLVVITAWRFQQ